MDEKEDSMLVKRIAAILAHFGLPWVRPETIAVLLLHG